MNLKTLTSIPGSIAYCLCVPLALGFALTLFVNLAPAQSPEWADKRLTTRNGLVLWLDADAIHAARTSDKQAALDNDEAVDKWPDASGTGRDFLQTAKGDQPTLVQVGDAWTVRFDGDSDHMRCTTRASELTAATLFIVASPHSNPGEFRGLLSSNAPNKRDYESGITIDLGAGSTTLFEHINVEGAGFGGARNLLKKAERFGTLHTIEAAIDPTKKQVTLTLDGKKAGERPFDPRAVSIEQLTLAARFYTNGPGEHIVRGPLKCDIAEVLVYDRILNSDEANSVREYLKAKHAKLAELLPGELKLVPGVSLVKAENPPPIQMLVPGFTVRELQLI